MLNVKNYLKSIISTGLLVVAILASPVIMDEAKDIYLVEIAAPKASPVAIMYNGKKRTVASSSQIKFKGRRFTLTNHHVCRIAAREFRQPFVRDAELVGQKLFIGDRALKILALDTEHDLCILEPDLSKSYFTFASNYHMGERITVIGHPRGLPQTIREGRLVAYREWVAPWLPVEGKIKSIMISALSYGGNSGSPVLNRFGNLVGVLFAGRSGIHTEAEIVPLENVINFLLTYIGE